MRFDNQVQNECFMKVFMLFMTFISFLPTELLSAREPDVGRLRNLYYKAATEKDSAVKLAEMLKTVNGDSPAILVCYKGVSEMIKAKYLINPFNKWNKFKNGRKLIEQAVRDSPQGVEIRFLRFCIQTNLPGFLGYSKDIAADQTFLLDKVNQLDDNGLKQNIKNYLLKLKNGS